MFFPMVFVDGLGWGIFHHFCGFWMTFWLHFGSPGLSGGAPGPRFRVIFRSLGPKRVLWGRPWGPLGGHRVPWGGTWGSWVDF